MKIKTTIKPNGGSSGSHLSVWEGVKETKWGLRCAGESIPAKRAAGLSYEETGWAGDPRKRGYEVDVSLGIPANFGWYIVRIHRGGDCEILYDPTNPTNE